MFNRSVAAVLICSVFAYGCASTTANPVQLAQLGDDAKSCDAIANEMQQMLQAQATAQADRNKQIAGNVALGVAGAFLLVPLFFMDTGNAATVEERAAGARYQRLNQMQIDRKCPAVTPAAQTAPIAAAPPAVNATPATPAVGPATVAPIAVPSAVAMQSKSTPETAPVVARSEATVTQPAASADRVNLGQYSWNAERLPDSKSCAEKPQAVLVAKGPGSETYTVACSDGNALAVRCDYGNCRVLR